jgi:hypothetical protein
MQRQHADGNSVALAASIADGKRTARLWASGTMLCSESTPLRCLLATGTPSTGTVVLAAIMPAMAHEKSNKDTDNFLSRR